MLPLPSALLFTLILAAICFTPLSRPFADDHPAFVVALESASTITSTVAPCFSLVFSPCSSVSVFSIRISRYRSAASWMSISAFSGCPAPSGLIILFTVAGSFFLHLLVRSNPPGIRE